MILIVTGVAGSGKSTVGRMLSAHLGLSFFDADDFHPPANIAKMQRGQALTEGDRAPWLERLSDLLRRQEGAGAVLACSALRESYRQALRAPLRREPRWIFLHGPEALLRARLQARSGHFAGAALLRSQLETLEPPAYALSLSIEQPVEALVAEIIRQLGSAGPSMAGSF